MPKNRLIKTDHITYRYPLPEDPDSGKDREKIKELQEKQPKALDQVDLFVEEGEFLCILGGNGSGKSTLARHLNALLLPDEGVVWVDGMNSSDSSKLFHIRSEVGMVFQNPDNQMISSRVDEEVAFGLENLGVPTEKIIEEVDQALKNVGMTGYDDQNPTFLSGGQKQRIAIAGILAMKPKCIVLDESTTMLDPRGKKEIMESVIWLNKKLSITVICITHFMEEAVMADRILVMKDGKVFMTGTPKEIFTREKELEQAGLKLPVICRLSQELRKKGLDIPAGVLTAEELKECLIKIRKSNEHQTGSYNI